MPFSAYTIRCRVDPELDSALLSFQERMGEQYLASSAALLELESIRESLESSVTKPLKSGLDKLLATRNISSSDISDVMSLTVTDSREDLESSIRDRFGINIVNGRVIPPGNTEVSSLKVLTRLVGGISKLIRYTPDLMDVPISSGSEDSYRSSSDLKNRFLFVTTYTETTVVPATKCSPEFTQTLTRTAAVDASLTDAARLVDKDPEDLTGHLFWLGQPDPSPLNRNKATSLGLSKSQFIDALSLRSTESLVVYRISDPLSIVRIFLSFGLDSDSVIERSDRPISTEIDPATLVSDLRDTLSRSSGSSTPTGFRDLTSSAPALVSSIDLDATFSLSDSLSTLENEIPLLSPEAGAIVTAIVGTLRSQLLALKSALSEAQEFVSSVFIELSNVQTLVYNLLGNRSTGLMDCVFGSGFSPSFSYPDAGVSSLVDGIGGVGGPGTPGTLGITDSNVLEDIITTIENQSTMIRDFSSKFNNLMGSLSSVSCAGSFISNSLVSVPRLPSAPLSCLVEESIDFGFELPSSIQEVVGLHKQAMDFASTLFDFSISNSRALRLASKNLALSLRSELETGMSMSSSGTGSSPGGTCSSPETARLSQLLQQRAQASFSGDNT